MSVDNFNKLEEIKRKFNNLFLGNDINSLRNLKYFFIDNIKKYVRKNFQDTYNEINKYPDLYISGYNYISLSKSLDSFSESILEHSSSIKWDQETGYNVDLEVITSLKKEFILFTFLFKEILDFLMKNRLLSFHIKNNEVYFNIFFNNSSIDNKTYCLKVKINRSEDSYFIIEFLKSNFINLESEIFCFSVNQITECISNGNKISYCELCFNFHII